MRREDYGLSRDMLIVGICIIFGTALLGLLGWWMMSGEEAEPTIEDDGTLPYFDPDSLVFNPDSLVLDIGLPVPDYDFVTWNDTLAVERLRVNFAGDTVFVFDPTIVVIGEHVCEQITRDTLRLDASWLVYADTLNIGNSDCVIIGEHVDGQEKPGVSYISSPCVPPR